MYNNLKNEGKAEVDEIKREYDGQKVIDINKRCLGI